jgi:hypothetical protein
MIHWFNSTRCSVIKTVDSTSVTHRVHFLVGKDSGSNLDELQRLQSLRSANHKAVHSTSIIICYNNIIYKNINNNYFGTL